jgi:quinol monooxygenase YgiN
MSKVALVVTLKIADGKLDAFMPAVLGHASRCMMQEEGCLQFDVLKPQDRPNEVRIYEVYRDQEALDEHANGASLRQMRDETEGMVVERDLVQCTPYN